MSATYTATLLNLDPSGLDMYSRIADNVLARLTIAKKEYRHSYWVDTHQEHHEFPFVDENYLNNLLAQGIIIYGNRSEFLIVEFTDGPTLTREALRHPKFHGAMVMQYHEDELRTLIPYQLRNHIEEYMSKLVPGFFTRNDFIAHPPFDVGMRYTTSNYWPAKPYTAAVDKLIFGGTIHPHVPERQVLHHLRNHPDFVFVEGYTSPNGKNNRAMDKDVLLRLYGEHKGVLALRGTSGFCFREFDALHAGQPLFMPPWFYKTQMEPLVDNEHYFAIDYDANPEVFAQRIMDRFHQVRGDVELLNRVRLNGQAWFHRNAEIPHIADRIATWIMNTLEPHASVF